jgi:hypothetical protein
VNLREVRQLAKGSCVPKGNEADAVVDEGRLGRQSRGFLSTAETTSADEQAGVLAVQRSLLPELACRIPEGLREKKGSKFQPNANKRGEYMHTFHCPGKLP